MLDALDVPLCLPGRGDAIAVWGANGVASIRAQQAALRSGKPLIWLEDAPLRSVHPNDRLPIGIFVDHQHLATESGVVTDLETRLNEAGPTTQQAHDALDLWRAYRMSKYNHWPDGVAPPPGPFVLICDQLYGDAAVSGAAADQAVFTKMHSDARAYAQAHDLPLVVRAHPRGQGYLAPRPGDIICPANAHPVDCLDRAVAIFTVSSQLGFEAILHGHKPHVYGAAWYSGWGLSADQIKIPRRTNTLDPANLFQKVMMEHARWFDPYRDEPCDVHRAITLMHGAARSAQRTAGPISASGISQWKRPVIRKILGPGVRFRAQPRHGETAVHWATKPAAPKGASLIEDGPLRSRGLGAALVPPTSIVLDRIGIHFDATRPSEFEHLVGEANDLPNAALARSIALADSIIAAGLSKYSLPGSNAALSEPVILVPGQVADDASLRLGGGRIVDNLALLQEARRLHPCARIAYRPHPDVTAGLRAGVIGEAEALRHADMILGDTDLATLWPHLIGVVTMTSTLGFEALMRGIPVTCLGWPFYAGWGHTHDHGPALPDGRRCPVTKAALLHAALIDYPIYLDPQTGNHTAPEIIVDRLAAGDGGAQTVVQRALGHAQSRLAPFGPIWRR